MNGKTMMAEFEHMIAQAEANTYSKLSLERPLTDAEFKKFKEASAKLGIEVD